MFTNFKDFIVNLFPYRFRREDTLKDISNKGVFERYMEIFGEELDENFSPEIENYLNIISYKDADAKFLNHISDILGNPPDIFQDETTYRKLLQFIVNVYKLKGSRESYEFFFNLMGYSVTIIEHYQKDIKYDIAILYDTNPEGDILHDNNCPSCTDYCIVFYDINDDPLIPIINTISDTTIQKLKDIIFFVEPINAHLRCLIQGAKVEDSFNTCFNEDIILSITNTTKYDNSLLFDSFNQYDNSSVLSGATINNNSCSPNPPEGISYWIIENDFEVQP